MIDGFEGAMEQLGKQFSGSGGKIRHHSKPPPSCSACSNCREYRFSARFFHFLASYFQNDFSFCLRPCTTVHIAKPSFSCINHVVNACQTNERLTATTVRTEMELAHSKSRRSPQFRVCKTTERRDATMNSI